MFLLLAGGLVVVIIPVVIAVVSSVVSAIAASQDIGEDEQRTLVNIYILPNNDLLDREKVSFPCPYFIRHIEKHHKIVYNRIQRSLRRAKDADILRDNQFKMEESYEVSYTFGF